MSMQTEVPAIVTCPDEQGIWVETFQCLEHLELDFNLVKDGQPGFTVDFSGASIESPYENDDTGYYLHERQPTASILPRFINMAIVKTNQNTRIKYELMDVKLVGPQELSGRILPCLVMKSNCNVLRGKSWGGLLQLTKGATMAAPAIQFINEDGNLDWFQVGDVIRRKNDNDTYFATDHWMVVAIVVTSVSGNASLIRDKYSSKAAPVDLLLARLHSVIGRELYAIENPTVSMQKAVLSEFEWTKFSFNSRSEYVWVDNWEKYYSFNHKKLTPVASTMYANIICHIYESFDFDGYGDD